MLGQKSAQWHDIFGHVRNPGLLWDTWKPKSLESYDVRGLWDCYTFGEFVLDESDTQTGQKPPLRLIEEYFKASWRSKSTVILQLSFFFTDF